MSGTTSPSLAVVAAITCLLIVRCACDDQSRYRNHRIASKNETAAAAAATETTKFPARVLHASPPSGAKATTETSSPGDDAVRLYITPSGKRKQDAAAATRSTVVQVQASSSSSPSPQVVARNPPPPPLPTYYVTASANRMVKTASSSYDDVRDTMNFRTPAAEEQKKRSQQQQQKTTNNNNNNNNNNWQQSQLLYASTQQQQQQQSDNVATSTTSTAVIRSSQSKPFASVFVPKKMLQDSAADSSFRPIASPAGAPFSYVQQPPPQLVKTTDRAPNTAVGKPQRAKTPPPPPSASSTAAASYKVEEYATERPTLLLQSPASNSVFDVVSGYNGRVSVADKSSKQHDQVKRQEFPDYVDPSRYYEYAAARQSDAALGDYFYKSAADKYETAVKPSSSSSLFEYEKPRAKERPGASPWLGSSAAEDANAKEALRQLLRDVFTSKPQQHGDTQKSKSSGVGEFMDAYFKTGPSHAADFGGLDDYDIETDMSCNLRSTKYVTDGHCVTTRPIVEAVCADRCLVYSTSQTSQRQRLSPTASQQVEALHCVDGDVKFLRVQLKCRDGNTLNNIIKVVTNCRCKLHQIQPQMRSNMPVSI